LIAQVAQVIIFFSLVSSLVTNAYPEDSLMSALLPALLAVPVVLTFIFETPLWEYLRSYTKPNAEGNVGLAGRWFLDFRRHAVRITDRLVGAVGPEEARLDTQAKWQDHSEKHGSTKLHISEKQSMQNRSMRDITLLLRSSLSRKLRVTTVEADIPDDEGGNRRQSEAITVTADMPGGAPAETAEQDEQQQQQRQQQD